MECYNHIIQDPMASNDSKINLGNAVIGAGLRAKAAWVECELPQGSMLGKAEQVLAEQNKEKAEQMRSEQQVSVTPFTTYG